LLLLAAETAVAVLGCAGEEPSGHVGATTATVRFVYGASTAVDPGLAFSVSADGTVAP